MSSIDVLDILEEVCAGDDGKHIDVLLAYIDELEDGVGIVDKMSSLDGDKVIIRTLEGYASFLQLLIEVEDEDEHGVLSTDYDTALSILSEYQEQSRKFENSIKGTDYAYGGFMSEDDD